MWGSRKRSWMAQRTKKVWLKWAIPGLFLLFSSFQHLTVNIINVKSCQWLDSNLGSLVSEATALPTEPQSLPVMLSLMPNKNISQKDRLCGRVQIFTSFCGSRSKPSDTKLTSKHSSSLWKIISPRHFCHLCIAVYKCSRNEAVC